MFIDRISLTSFRTFRKAEIDFVHADQDFDKLGFAAPKLRNINLLVRA